MPKKLYALALLLLVACSGSSANLSFSPSVSVGPGGTNSSPPPTVVEAWIIPNHASIDMLDMFRRPNDWINARMSLSAFGFIQRSVYPFPNANSCDDCGQNIYQNFMTVVPGGAFKWLTDRGIKISVEGGATKDYTCGESAWKSVVAAKGSMKAIQDSGAKVSYFSMDEPFTAGLASKTDRMGIHGGYGCGYTLSQTASDVKFFINSLHRTDEYGPGFPDLEVGLIEPYSHFSVEQIESFVLELEQQGVRLPYLYLDMDMYRVMREKQNISRDLQRIHEFCQQRRIVFGMIVWGEEGSSNQTFYRDAMKMVMMIKTSMKLPPRLIFYSWGQYPGDDVTKQFENFPENIPESDPTTLTGLLNTAIDYLFKR